MKITLNDEEYYLLQGLVATEIMRRDQEKVPVRIGDLWLTLSASDQLRSLDERLRTEHARQSRGIFG